MGGSSQPAGSTTTTTEPWSGVKPYLTGLYADADRLGNQPMQTFRPSGFTRAEQMGQGAAMDVARGGIPSGVRRAETRLDDTLAGNYLDRVRPAFRAGQGQIQDTARGRYLSADANPFMSGDINPYAESLYSAASRPVIESFNEETLPALTAQFAQAGQVGSPQQQAVQVDAASDLQRNLADMSSQIYGNIYESERDRMQRAFEGERGRMMGASGLAGQMYGMERGEQTRAMALAPQIGTLSRNIGLQNADIMSQIGGARRDLRDARGQAGVAASREPWERLNLQAQMFGSGSPFMAQSQPYYRNRGAGMLGGAATGAGLGGMIGGPVGAGIGGLGGLVLGGLL